MIDGSRAHLSSRVTSKNRQQQQRGRAYKRSVEMLCIENREESIVVANKNAGSMERNAKYLPVARAFLTRLRSFFIVLSELALIT